MCFSMMYLETNTMTIPTVLSKSVMDLFCTEVSLLYTFHGKNMKCWEYLNYEPSGCAASGGKMTTASQSQPIIPCDACLLSYCKICSV